MKQLLKKSIQNDSMQWIATFSVSLLSMQMGIYYGWTSPNTAQLSSANSPIPSTPTDISWLVSLSPIGFFVGAVIGSILVEFIGCRKTVIVTYSVIATSWICVLIANFVGSIGWLFAARFIGGFLTTMLWCSCAIYLSEISAAEMRGTMVSLGMLGSPFGYLIGVTAETYVNHKITCVIYLSMISVGMALLFYLKDSPYFFVKHGDMENAKKSIEFYRRHINVDEVLKEVKIFVEKNDSSMKDKLSQLRQPGVKKALWIILIAFALPDACGSLTISSYTETILIKSGFKYIEPEQFVIYNYVISLISSFLTVRVLDTFGRKIALIISSIGTGMSLIAIGVQFSLLDSGSKSENLQWVGVCAILAFFITFNVGFSLVPHALLSEMFPENMKGIASFVASLSGAICAFAAVKSFQPVADTIGVEYLFWIHAGLCFTGVPFALFFLIETKGKSFQQIQDELALK